MSKLVFLILAATISALIDFQNQKTAEAILGNSNLFQMDFAKNIIEKVQNIDFFRWLEKRTFGHRNFEDNFIRSKMIAAVKPSKESFVEHFRDSSFNVLEKKGVVLSHGNYFDRVIGIYLLEKIIYKEKYKFIAAPEVVIFPFNWGKAEENGLQNWRGPAFAMEYIRGVCPNFLMAKYVPKKSLNKEQFAEMQDLLKRHYVDYVYTRNGPNFLFDRKKIVCIDTERHNFPNIDRLGSLHHEVCQRALLKTNSNKKRDDSKKATSPKSAIELPKITPLKILDGSYIKSIGNGNMKKL